jgi:RNA polymerase sigma-70 factor, Bacteroides expansion family 1
MPGRYHTYEDDILLTLLAKGDKQAFTEIYDRYWEKLYYIAGKKVINLGEAENLVHDIFLDLWQRRETLVIQTRLSHYLAVAMKFRVLKLLARQKRMSKLTMEAKEWVGADNPEKDLQFEDLNKKLGQLVNDLPPQCRIAFQLRNEGRTQKEIASAMNIAEHTVERHISRALKSLRINLLRMFS